MRAPAATLSEHSGDAVVEADVSVPDEPLEARARVVGQERRQGRIHPLAVEGLGNGQTDHPRDRVLSRPVHWTEGGSRSVEGGRTEFKACSFRWAIATDHVPCPAPPRH